MTLFTSKCEQSLCFEHFIIKFTDYVRRKLLPVFLVKTNFKILLVTKRYSILRDFCWNYDSRSELILMMLVVVVLSSAGIMPLKFHLNAVMKIYSLEA